MMSKVTDVGTFIGGSSTLVDYTLEPSFILLFSPDTVSFRLIPPYPSLVMRLVAGLLPTVATPMTLLEASVVAVSHVSGDNCCPGHADAERCPSPGTTCSVLRNCLSTRLHVPCYTIHSGTRTDEPTYSRRTNTPLMRSALEPRVSTHRPSLLPTTPSAGHGVTPPLTPL